MGSDLLLFVEDDLFDVDEDIGVRFLKLAVVGTGGRGGSENEFFGVMLLLLFVRRNNSSLGLGTIDWIRMSIKLLLLLLMFVLLFVLIGGSDI